MRCILIASAAVLACGGAQAQTRAGLSDSAKGMIGSWEFSNAEHEKVCSVRFSADRATVGYRLRFDANCGTLFALVKRIVGWKFPQGDLLYLIDDKGQTVIEFGEVEDGIFEAPTPGLGVLFLQNASAAHPASKSPREAAGDWMVVRGEGPPLCVLTFARDGFSVTARPDCDPDLAKLDFTQWRLDGRELVLIPANGEPWRFEEVDGNWRRLSNEVEPVMLVRQ